MVWKVRADCTYTSTTNKSARQSAVEALLSGYPSAVPATGEENRYPGGVTSQSASRFTVAYDFASGASAQAFATALTDAVTQSARSATLVSVHDAGG